MRPSPPWRLFGSSPLARGLPGDGPGGRGGGGIIPARAGFTSLRGSSRGGCGDHPRSRGVYSPGRSGRRSSRGSSPLARGLPDIVVVLTEPPRIIPARAGFTALGRQGSALSRDHPRSRGVYSPPRPRSAPPSGSSPLARGLQAAARDITAAARIIPARAGFTRIYRRVPPVGADHPRSRGVYALTRRIPVTPRGSSPLARGLLLPLRARQE